MIGTIRRIAYATATQHLSRLSVVEGRLKGTDVPFRCLFVSTSDFTESLKKRLYEEPPAVVASSRIWLRQARKRIEERLGSVDLCVAVLPKGLQPAFEGFYDFRTTEVVRQVIDTSGTWDEIRGRFSNNKRRIANKFADRYGLAYRISNDLADFDLFYHRMFVPHIRKRFGDLADIESYEDMKAHFHRGHLVFITKGDTSVAGALSLVENGAIVFRRTGVLDGDESHVEGGAQTALYYFQLKYASDNHLKAVDTMLSDPFLNDGVYQHKREWGARVLPDAEATRWVYFVQARPSEKMARAFERIPLVYYSENGLGGLIGVPEAADASDPAVGKTVYRYKSDGIQDFTVMTPTGTFRAQ